MQGTRGLHHEPNYILRQLICIIFQSTEPTAVEYGIEALRALSVQAFDVVIIEMRICSPDGFALRSGLEKEAPKTCVILFSGTPQDSQIRSAFDACFLKPARMSILLDEVTKADALFMLSRPTA